MRKKNSILFREKERVENYQKHMLEKKIQVIKRKNIF